MLRDELVGAGHEVILAWRLPSHSTLVPLSVRFPDFSVAGFLDPPNTHTYLDKWSVIPTFMEVLEPWVRVWLILKEKWTWCKVWA